MNTRLVALALAFALSSCAVEIYDRPPEASGTTSIVQGTAASRSLSDRDWYVLHAVDGKTAMRMFQSYVEAKIPVTEGRRLLRVSVSSNRPGLRDCECRFTATLESDIKPGRSYRVVGTATGTQATVWIEDEQTKERASGVFGASGPRTEENDSSGRSGRVRTDSRSAVTRMRPNRSLKPTRSSLRRGLLSSKRYPDGLQ